MLTPHLQYPKVLKLCGNDLLCGHSGIDQPNEEQVLQVLWLTQQFKDCRPLRNVQMSRSCTVRKARVALIDLTNLVKGRLLDRAPFPAGALDSDKKSLVRISYPSEQRITGVSITQLFIHVADNILLTIIVQAIQKAPAEHRQDMIFQHSQQTLALLDRLTGVEDVFRVQDETVYVHLAELQGAFVKRTEQQHSQRFQFFVVIAFQQLPCVVAVFSTLGNGILSIRMLHGFRKNLFQPKVYRVFQLRIGRLTLLQSGNDFRIGIRTGSARID